MRFCGRCKHWLADELFESKRTGKGDTVLKKCCTSCCSKMTRYNSKPDRRAAEKKRQQGDAAKASRKRYTNGEIGKLVQSRANRKPIRNVRQKKKRDDNPGYRLRCALTAKLGQMLHGTYKSKSILKFTEFTDTDDVQDFFQCQLYGDMRLENYGKVWHVDHIIACRWYSDSKEDMKRLWSKANLQPMRGSENQSKGVSIPSYDVLQSIGERNWPVSWNGTAPDKEKRVAMYQSVHPGSSVFSKGF